MRNERRGYRPAPAPRPAAYRSQVQRSAWGTPASASSMCWPQPVQVTLPHVSQRMGEHMVVPPNPAADQATDGPESTRARVAT